VSAANLPKYNEFLWPILCALRELGGSAAIEELNAKVISSGGYSDEQQAVLLGDGPRTVIEYRLGWTRTYLKGMGLAVNSERGVWSLTEEGRTVTEPQLEPLRQAYLARLDRARKASKSLGSSGHAGADEPETDEPSWREQLLDEVMRLSPANFEKLAQRLLREEGFINTQVTGRSGDGGIDGQGVYRLSLLSFQVFFQCKRYAGSVGSGAVRDFRGAMAGRGDKGLLITTGTFTSSAREEATRDGAPPIDLEVPPVGIG
jgi:restriction endonuclease